jgi:feruloyl-CoA synthase
LERLSLRHCGVRVPILTSLGATETAPLAVASVHDAEGPGEIGLPVPGVELKLVPAGDKTEIRVRGPAVTPGYWAQPELTQAAFDDEGFYCLGDAVRFLDPADPSRGLVYDGRIAEDFKLRTGVWVNVGNLRARIVAALAPFIRDAVITGHDRDELGALLIPDLEACRVLAGENDDALSSRSLRRAIADGLSELSGAGSSERIARAIVVRTPLSLDAGEVTDKGSINQRRVLDCRADLVDILYSEADNLIRPAAAIERHRTEVG